MRIELAGQALQLLPEGAVWWPEQDALLVADLHLGKDQVFRRHGMAVPASVLDGELKRLDQLLAAHPARELIVLGDLVHAPPEPGEDWPDVIAKWRGDHAGLAMGVVLGNHDRSLAAQLRAWDMSDLGECCERGGLALVHATDLDRPRPGLSGHLHPVARLRAGPERLRLPVFARRDQHLILPAFGRFTGGHDLGGDPTWQCLAAAGHRVVALG
ncbi:MAG: ligase-associated DNA damage response endonuclease PdeM [Wenzhouxiangella sp.]|jgi:DNA ligase-associated metallophosphoesterase|nr:ligase-associated DNA damage response endonuclease PdeM [Wenzhouxiangella sp.]